MNTPAFAVIRRVSKTYSRGERAIRALHDFSIEIRKGEFVVLAGPSGSGKTTLLNLIAALDQPDDGEIIVSGTDLSKLSLAAAASFRAKYVGIVFQTYNLLPQLTALQNVLLPMIARRQPDERRALDLLDCVGLGARSRHLPSQLSGGEQQRVAIARALANHPALVLADEPTGNLDDASGRLVLNMLHDSCRERGTTLLLATHDRQAREVADKVVLLRSGEPIELTRSADAQEAAAGVLSR